MVVIRLYILSLLTGDVQYKHQCIELPYVTDRIVCLCIRVGYRVYTLL